MSKAVRFDRYGNVDVLEVIEVEKPSPSPGRVQVRVVTAEIARLVADGELQIRVAAVYNLQDVRQAYTQLAVGHTGGKIVLQVTAP
jgi:NADPH:quinone reductase-like Zn-dependent oxidoreductase